MKTYLILAIAIILWSCAAARAAEVTLIAPGGISAAVEQMIPAFEKSTGHKARRHSAPAVGPSSKLSAASPSTCRSCKCRWRP